MFIPLTSVCIPPGCAVQWGQNLRDSNLTKSGLGNACVCSVTEHRPPGAAEQEIFDLQQGTREVWERCTVTAHFDPEHDVAGTLQAPPPLVSCISHTFV